MRVVRLLLLCLLAYLLTVIIKFPVQPVLARVAPQIEPVKISGASGSVLAGQAQEVLYDDALLPLRAENVRWRLTPQKLLTGAAGVAFSFESMGGQGAGDFAQKLGGVRVLSDLNFTAPAQGFEALLPAPVARFGGTVDTQVEELVLKDQLLESLRARLLWQKAQINSEISADLGTLQVDVVPIEDQTHRAAIVASGGELGVEGTIEIKQNGDYVTNLMVTPTATARPELVSALRGYGRADSSGRFRIQSKGNVNRLM